MGKARLTRMQPTAVVGYSGGRTIFNCVCGDTFAFQTKLIPNSIAVHLWRSDHNMRCQGILEELRSPFMKAVNKILQEEK